MKAMLLSLSRRPEKNIRAGTRDLLQASKAICGLGHLLALCDFHLLLFVGRVWHARTWRFWPSSNYNPRKRLTWKPQPLSCCQCLPRTPCHGWMWLSISIQLVCRILGCQHGKHNVYIICPFWFAECECVSNPSIHPVTLPSKKNWIRDLQSIESIRCHTENDDDGGSASSLGSQSMWRQELKIYEMKRRLTDTMAEEAPAIFHKKRGKEKPTDVPWLGSDRFEYPIDVKHWDQIGANVNWIMGDYTAAYFLYLYILSCQKRELFHSLWIDGRNETKKSCRRKLSWYTFSFLAAGTCLGTFFFFLPILYSYSFCTALVQQKNPPRHQAILTNTKKFANPSAPIMMYNRNFFSRYLWCKVSNSWRAFSVAVRIPCTFSWAPVNWWRCSVKRVKTTLAVSSAWNWVRAASVKTCVWDWAYGVVILEAEGGWYVPAPAAPLLAAPWCW